MGRWGWEGGTIQAEGSPGLLKVSEAGPLGDSCFGGFQDIEVQAGWKFDQKHLGLVSLQLSAVLVGWKSAGTNQGQKR